MSGNAYGCMMAAEYCSCQDAGFAIWQPGCDSPRYAPANQAVHPSGVDKLIVIIRQGITTVEYCGLKFIRLYDDWYVACAAVGRSYCMVVSCSCTSSWTLALIDDERSYLRLFLVNG